MKGRPACLRTIKKALSLYLSLVEYVRADHKEILLSAVQLTDPLITFLFLLHTWQGFIFGDGNSFLMYESALTCIQVLKVASYIKINHSAVQYIMILDDRIA